MQRSLRELYDVDSRKFDVEYLLFMQKVVSNRLLERLENRIQNKIKNHGKRKENIYIDFGPYPLAKSWQFKEPQEEFESVRSARSNDSHNFEKKKAARQEQINN